MTLALGQRVIATRDSGVNESGEIGVVYEIYSREGWEADDQGDGVSIIFEKGGYDGFSPKEQRMMLKPLDERCPFASGYIFRNVGQVSADHRAGRFTFYPAGKGE